MSDYTPTFVTNPIDRCFTLRLQYYFALTTYIRRVMFDGMPAANQATTTEIIYLLPFVGVNFSPRALLLQATITMGAREQCDMMAAEIL